VQPVRAAARLSARRLIAAAAVAAAVVAALALTVGASGRDHRTPPAPAPAARSPTVRVPLEVAPARSHAPVPRVTRIGGKALQSARCAHWQEAGARRRDAVVATLAQVVGGPTPYGRATTLPADVAHQLFDRTCTRHYARGFLLYELYTRAAAFYATPRRNL